MANDMTLAFADARTGTLDCRPKPVCDPRPVCPACGGLECLCRPRFFAGQLLTEEDLNRLDYYIVAKNRLHNRYLFGTGVVCGLEVVCSACDPAGGGSVIVKPGYALSPCGNDVVVCKEESVNVCDLINRCRPRPPDDCFQPGGNTEDCQQGNEQWVLAICYQERQTRGITALRGASCTCGCGGGSGCTCGGKTAMPTGATYMSEASCGCDGGTTTRTAKTKPSAKAGLVPPQCEPTLVCEGYTFAVYKAPKKDDKKVYPGALIMRFLCCLQPLIEQLETLPKAGATQNARQEWLLELIATVREFLIAEGLYDCDVAAKLAAVVLPSVAPPSLVGVTYQSQWNSATLAVFAIIATIFQKCLCAALLPPCPPAEMNDCVPIATLTVARGHCRVRQICNIGNRRFLLTFPAIEYWLSWLPLFASWPQSQSGTQPGGLVAAPSPGAKTPTLRELIDRLCCMPIAEVGGVDLNPPAIATPGANVSPSPPATAAGPTSSLHLFMQLLAESIVGAAPKANAATLLLAAMGARNTNGSALVSDAALANPGQAMLIQQVLGPALMPLLGATGGVPAAQLETLAAAVDTLQTQVNGILDKLANG